ncbi:hypothetical protein DFH09DRAFT_1439505 [Mycena vulgaris]|nr:hypothetical protein DFH09DRAFT_1439505 [Mycena vulgaris]
MPFTFSAAMPPANAMNIGPLYQDGLTGEQVLARTCGEQYEKASEVLQFALSGSEGSDRDFTTASSTCEENREFWGKVAHYQRGGSGPSYYSGRINVFNVFSKEGEWLGHKLDTSATTQTAPDAMYAATFWRTHAFDVPPSYAEVDVMLDDNDKMFECVMVAGTIGTQVSSSGDHALSENGEMLCM